MTHLYNDDSTPIVSTSSSFQKDQLGLFFIGLIAFLGLGYALYNPVHLQSDNYPADDAQIFVSPASLNSEKLTYDLLDTRTPSMDTQIATDSKN